MTWYQGAPLLHVLEHLHISSDFNKVDPRFPVQTVLRPQREGFIDYRGYAGRVASGIFRPGDPVMVLPSGFSSTIKTIERNGREIDEAFAPMSIAMTLTDDIDISRGDMIVRENNQPKATQEFDAMICWLDSVPARPRAKYSILHCGNEQKAMIKQVVHQIDINTLNRIEGDPNLAMNAIAKVQVRTTRPLMVDAYRKNRQSGSFILVDDATHNTVAAGMIL